MSTRLIDLSPWYSVTEAVLQDESGVRTTWHYQSHPGATVVLALSGDEILMLREWRAAVGGFCWQLPGGRIDEGETPLEAAKRELEEETLIVGGDWTYLHATWVSPGSSDEVAHLFLVQDFARPDTTPVDAIWTSRAEVVSAALDGGLEDASSALAILRAEQISAWNKVQL